MYFLFLIIIFQISKFSFCVDEDYNGITTQVCFGKRNSRNYQYQNNVNVLLLRLISESSSSHLGYVRNKAGHSPNKAYGSYLCRGDLSSNTCRECLERVKQYILDRKNVDKYKECFAYDMHLRCIIHNSKSSIPFKYQENSHVTTEKFGDSLTLNPNYNKALSNLKQELVQEASYGNWAQANFATKVVGVGKTHEKIFFFVQCMPYLSPMSCSNCLGNLSSPNTKGGLVLNFNNCFMKFNNQSFLGSGYHFNPNFVHVIFILLFTMYLTFL